MGTFRALAAALGLVAVAAGLLAMRQQRLAMLHEAAVLHEQMDDDRQAVWGLESRIADAGGVDRLQHQAIGDPAAWRPAVVGENEPAPESPETPETPDAPETSEARP